MKKNNFSSIESIIKTVKKNGMYILVDDESKHEEMENEGDLVISTSAVNPKNINFMAKYARGLICLAMDSNQSKKYKFYGKICKRFDLFSNGLNAVKKT